MVKQKFYGSCSRTRRGPGDPSRALVAVRWMFTSADCSQPGMALSRCAIFWISSPNIPWICQGGGAGMSSGRRRWSCSVGCVSHPCPSCIPLEKPESFLWNVAQGCFFLQNESELVQFSCKTLSCLRGPLFKNKDTLKTNFPPPKNSFGGWNCH